MNDENHSSGKRKKHPYVEAIEQSDFQRRLFETLEKIFKYEDVQQKIFFLRSRMVHYPSGKLMRKEGLPSGSTREKFHRDVNRYFLVENPLQIDQSTLKGLVIYDSPEEKYLMQKYPELELLPEAFLCYLLYGNLELLKKEGGITSYVEVINLRHYLRSGLVLDDKLVAPGEAEVYSWLQARSQRTPLVLFVRPGLSKRVFLALAGRLYESAQQEFNDVPTLSELDTTKKRSSYMKRRNDFIYENRHLPKNELTSLVNDRFATRDGKLFTYDYLNKIIQRETKSRKSKPK